eukprot:CAMPEP_0170626446 /NCGR_PEP_ID=MMETSP0224-20130122/31362_1 /TAXON_ID=285029 /ORGANISM="Togula jolla, Strain CCCM 725" /LENGTH=130 /DNA_ID=CAMNT_0010953219 /DNA_START=1297 /DNA_END=1686 /DNA_ORIENTATION=-
MALHAASSSSGEARVSRVTPLHLAHRIVPASDSIIFTSSDQLPSSTQRMPKYTFFNCSSLSIALCKIDLVFFFGASSSPCTSWDFWAGSSATAVSSTRDLSCTVSPSPTFVPSAPTVCAGFRFAQHHIAV